MYGNLALGNCLFDNLVLAIVAVGDLRDMEFDEVEVMEKDDPSYSDVLAGVLTNQ